MSGYGHDRFLALRAGGACSLAKNRQPFLNRWIVRLEADHAPGTLHQGRAQAWITVFGHAARDPLTPAAVFTRTQPGVRTNGPPILKPFPRTNLRVIATVVNFPIPTGTLAGAAASSCELNASICSWSVNNAGRCTFQTNDHPAGKQFTQSRPRLIFPPMGR